MPFFSRLFFAIACFFRLIFDGRFATAVEQTKLLPASPPAGADRKRSNTPGERGERHAIPPSEGSSDARDTDSLPPPRFTPSRDTLHDDDRSTPDDDDDDLYSIPPVSTDSHHTGLRRRSPPKPTTVPPPADAEASRIPPTEPSPRTFPPSSGGDTDPKAASESSQDSMAGSSDSATAEKPTEQSDAVDAPKLSEDTVKSLPAIDVNSPPPEDSGKSLADVKTTPNAPSSSQSTARDVEVPISGERFAPRERGALLLLALLQREGRFVDFLQQEVTDFDDEQVGAAARVVHEGCRRALKGHLEVAPIRDEAEGDKVTLEDGYDVQANKLVGNVSGKPPYKGAVQHRGWRAERLQLPSEVGDHDPSVLAQAEVEL